MIRRRQTISDYILAYVFWLISTGLGVFVAYMVWELVQLVLVVLNRKVTDPKEVFYQQLQANAIKDWMWIALGVLAVVLLVVFESYYRSAVPLGDLYRRFFKVSGVACLALLTMEVAEIVIQAAFNLFRWTSLELPLFEALFAGLFLWLWRNQNKGSKELRE